MAQTNSRVSIGSAASTGILAYLVGYVLTYALSIKTVQNSGIAQLKEVFGDGGNGAWKMVGWVFYNAHEVTTTLDVDVPLFGGTSAVNFIARSDELSVILYIIPPALLVIAGLAAARMAGSTDVADALRIGPGVALGYLLLAIVGAFLFTVTVGDSVGKPTLVTAIGLAGIVYPVVFATLGAALGSVFADESTSGRTTA